MGDRVTIAALVTIMVMVAALLCGAGFGVWSLVSLEREEARLRRDASGVAVVEARQATSPTFGDSTVIVVARDIQKDGTLGAQRWTRVPSQAWDDLVPGDCVDARTFELVSCPEILSAPGEGGGRS